MATAFDIRDQSSNQSGVDPLDLRVVVKPDPAEERIGSIILPESEKDKQKWAMTKGVLIAAGVNAFAEARRNPSFGVPVPGTRVMFGKYAGTTFKGADGEDYTIMNDEDVVGLLIGE